MTRVDLLRKAHKAGWSMIPIPPTKRAVIKWGKYQAERPTTEQMREWIDMKPACWAVVTGTLSGVVCCDFDGERGKETLANLGFEPHCKTGSDGRHFYVRHPGVPVKTLNGPADPTLDAMYPGLDIRGDGGYAIFCGKSNKGEYEWLRDIEPEPWETLPEDLRNYITNVSTEPEPVELPATQPSTGNVVSGQPLTLYTDPRYWLERYLNQAIKGTRNQMGFRLAQELVTQCLPFGSSRGECESIMREYSQRVPRDSKDSYTPADAMRSFQKAMDYGPKEPCGVPAPRANIIHRGGIKQAHIDVDDADLDTELARYAHTDLGNAERFLARHRANLRYCKQYGQWLVWDGVRWIEDAGDIVTQFAAATTRAMVDEAKTLPDDDHKPSSQASALKWAHASEADSKLTSMTKLARSWVSVSPDDLDVDPWLLNCKNGLLDLRSGELLRHSQTNLITKLAPTDYLSDAKAPVWMDFLNTIFDGNRALIEYIQRAVGYGLTGVIREQCLFFLYGIGSNGKSTFLTAIQDAIGDYARDTPTETLMVKQSEGISNDVARLKGARFVTAVEAEAERRMAESLVKRLTGGDTITARFMRQEFFQFRGTFKIFLATNHKPSVRGTDDGIWRRIKLIPFLVQIPDEEQDGDLPDKLRAEAEGILAWAVRGCLSWQKNGLGQPTEVTEATASYRADMDYLGPFVTEKCVLGASETVASKDLYGAYLSYCETNHDKPVSQRKFGLLLNDRPRIVRTRGCADGGFMYRGIGLQSFSRPDDVERGLNDTEPYIPCNPCRNKQTNSTYTTTWENHSVSFSKPDEEEPEWDEEI